ncbi:MAG: hypothetical protein D6735_06700 [Acidobacteria bacterium]|jgi:Flp pilus assembly protein TadB|nr:MAG: hypothetical protein D6735_06700 [Acidobacteriota bacterium]
MSGILQNVPSESVQLALALLSSVFVVVVFITIPWEKILSQKVELEQFVDDIERYSTIERALIIPLAQSLYRRDTDKKESVQEKLDKLGYPSPYNSLEDYYLQKALMIFAFSMFGIISVFLLVALANLSPIFFVLVIPLAVFGYLKPDIDINSMLESRKKQIILEMPEFMDMLSIYYSSLNSLPRALLMIVGRSTMFTGYIFYEFRKALEAYLKGENFSSAVRKIAERNQDIQLLALSAERIAMAEERGLPLTESLRDFADRSRDMVETMLIEVAQRNTTLMVTGAAPAFIGILLAIGAPVVYVFINIFSR